MKKINFNLENCYGINKLKQEINFEDKSACLIYASNGTMKTSFADTLSDVQNNLISKDEIEPSNITIREILVDGNPIQRNEVLVIKPYIDSYESENKNKLLFSQKLKDEYNKIVEDINKNKDSFLKQMKMISKISNLGEIENEIVKNFSEDKNDDFLKCLEIIETEYDIEENKVFDGFKYKDWINEDVEKALSQDAVVKALNDYMQKYDEILKTSELYKPGIYDTTKANTVLKSLESNNFFKAKNKIALENNKIFTGEEYKKEIETIEENILNDEDIKKNYKIIETTLDKKVSLRNFKDLLYANKSVIPYLQNYSDFRRVLLLHYIAKNYEYFTVLLNLYKDTKGRIKEILKAASEEKTVWQEVTEQFNNRFKVPFEIQIENQADVILKEDVLAVKFFYKTKGDKKNVTREILEQRLSNGEKRALYILNILYELKAKELNGNECLVVFDDIADSFDYKNKYAIIEYLKDTMEGAIFKSIILTHNFDFYRSLASRLDLNSNSYFALKNDNEIHFEPGEYTKNVFQGWKGQLNNEKIFVSSIAFVRNIVEYLNGQKNDNYKILTNLLHYKINTVGNVKKTQDIKLDEILDIYADVWGVDKNKIVLNQQEKMIDCIFLCADNIKKDPNINEVKIENKIVLSIAIRLKAEIYMIGKINNNALVEAIDNNQTRELMKLMESLQLFKDDTIREILEEVLIMTSENIHINSFMYEPIIDMSVEYLIRLYDRVENELR